MYHFFDNFLMMLEVQNLQMLEANMEFVSGAM